MADEAVQAGLAGKAVPGQALLDEIGIPQFAADIESDACPYGAGGPGVDEFEQAPVGAGEAEGYDAERGAAGRWALVGASGCG